MRIAIVCPAKPGSTSGNRVTALRWRRILVELGHRVKIVERLGRHACDLAIALHAARSAEAVEASRRSWPERPIVVAMTGTDLYGALARDPARNRTLRAADRVVVLHPRAAEALPASQRHKARFVPQSAVAPIRPRARARAWFEVVVAGHLRDEKDPFRAALASRRLPRPSRVRVIHVGAALTPSMGERARREMKENPRYAWLGEVSPGRARALIASASLVVLSSKLEGGANVLSEAIAAGTPVLVSRIPCTLGLMGPDYEGYFRVGDTRALAARIDRAERDPSYLDRLARQVRSRRRVVSVTAEKAAWRALLDELA